MAFADTMRRISQHEAFGGILLMIAAGLAMAVANSPLLPAYDGFLEAKRAITGYGMDMAKTLILFTNDGLIAEFFPAVRLELKREMRKGGRRNPCDVVLQRVVVLGGVAVPALVFVAINRVRPATLGGWVIPAATDIAFAAVKALAPVIRPCLCGLSKLCRFQPREGSGRVAPANAQQQFPGIGTVLPVAAPPAFPYTAPMHP